jgi:hypothetical protein
MAKAKKKKAAPKERPEKYEGKFSIEGNFIDVFKVVKKNKEDKKTTK